MLLRLHRQLPKLLSCGILLSLFLLLIGCGGQAGVENGQIVGKVYANLQGTSATRAPEAGVAVVAQRESGGEPRVIRTTTSDANGGYVFSGLPLGTYVLGFAKEGFVPIETQAGSSSQRTAVGTQVRIFVEPGLTAKAPDVTMRAVEPSGDVTLVLTILDLYTGQPVTDATVSVVGQATTQNTNGVYTVTVPLIGNNQTPFGGGTNLQATITINAEGYVRDQTEAFTGLFPGQVRQKTKLLQPIQNVADGGVTVTGTWRFAKYQRQLEVASTANIALSVKDLSGVGTQVNVPNGTWIVSNLPPSTATITRQYDFIFQHPNLKTYTLQRVIMPRTGTKTITQVVVLEPITVDVVATVYVTGDNGVTQYVPNSPDDKAWLEETGQQAAVVNGSFVIPAVPVQQAPGDQGWTLHIVVTHPVEKTLYSLNPTLQIRPISDTTPAPSNCPECAPGVWFAGIIGVKFRDP